MAQILFPFKRLLISWVPRRAREPLRALLGRFVYFGFSRRCSICHSSLRRFLPYGLRPREEALCPVCGSLERHRLVWLYMQSRLNTFRGRSWSLLHIAPEKPFLKLFSSWPGLEYHTADLSSPLARVRLDITAIPYRDGFFDVILCNHVLEHVPDDQMALRELCRVLKPDGWAILQVPVLRDVTFEDPSLQSPEERERLFGQSDHVRIYGKDYKSRLESAGFLADVDSFASDLDEKESRYYGLQRNEQVYFCRKLGSYE